LPKRSLVCLAALLALLAAAPVTGQSRAPAVSCESLAKMALPDTTITMAKLVGAGEFEIPQTPRGAGQGAPGAQGGPGGPGGPGGQASPSGQAGPGGPGGFGPQQTTDVKTLPAFCRIAATLKPTSDSSIRIEVWMPTTTWNGKLLGVGSGGMAGSIIYTSSMPIGLTEAIKLGYAAANTDVGHDKSTESADGVFLLGHPEKQIDFGYRAYHLMTVEAKEFIKAFYGAAAKHSYFIGCSLGSVNAMNEAKRYPEDYDGVISGAPMTRIAPFNAAQLWPTILIAKDPSKALSNAKISLLEKAVMQTCGTALDKQQGFLEDPSTCHFDPKTLLCKGADSADCLTAPQAEFVRQMYQGPVNPRTGEVVFMGVPYGAEGQMGASGTNPHGSSLAVYRYGVHQDANWDWKTLDFDKDIALAEKTVAPYMHVDADLNAFFNRGDKLMLYIGWEDYHNPLDTENYFKQLLKNSPAKADSMRLFVVPGMGHCNGGDGCGVFDKIAAMDKWVETGKAPDVLDSTKEQGGKVVMSRPLCAYPKVAKYKGSGDITEAVNFYCAEK